MWFTVNQNSFSLTWRKMNVIWNACGLKWMWSQMTVVSNDCGLKWMWSQMNVVSNERGLKWTWSQMNMVSNEQVSNEQVSNEYGLKLMWSQMNRSHMNVFSNEQVSNEQVSNVVVSNECDLIWSGLKWIVSNELVSIFCTPKQIFFSLLIISILLFLLADTFLIIALLMFFGLFYICMHGSGSILRFSLSPVSGAWIKHFCKNGPESLDIFFSSRNLRDVYTCKFQRKPLLIFRLYR